MPGPFPRSDSAEGVADVATGVLDVLARLLGVRSGLLRLALGEEAVVAGRLADALLRLAGELLGLVLGLVGDAHRHTSFVGLTDDQVPVPGGFETKCGNGSGIRWTTVNEHASSF